MTKLNSTLRLTLATIVVASLTACGGGGGGGGGGGTEGGDSEPPAQLVADEGNLVASAPAPTYGSGYRLDAFNAISSARALAGAGALTQSSQVDDAAVAHGNYINLNSFNPGFHTQSPSLAGFTGVTVADRIAAAGLSGGASNEILIGGVDMGAADAVKAILGTVYHGIALLSSHTLIGMGNAVDGLARPLLVIDQHTPPSHGPGQVHPAGTVVSYPYSGAIVSGAFAIDRESPRPAPGLVTGPNAGTPVNVSFRNADWVNAVDVGTLTARVTQASLSQVGVGAVPVVVLASPRFVAGAGVTVNSDNYLPEGFISLIPQAPLADGTYRVRMSVTVATGKVTAVDYTFQVLN